MSSSVSAAALQRCRRPAFYDVKGKTQSAEIRSIDYVVMGHQTAGGKQNIFIGDGDPSGATSRQAHIDRAQAESTPLRDSLQKMDTTPFAQTPGQHMPAPGQEPVAARR